MHITMVASEMAFVAKVGGLADVVFGLSRELQLRGHHVEVVLPKYDCLWHEQIHGLRSVYDDLSVPWFDGAVHCSVFEGHVHGVPCYFIDPHSEDLFFNRGCFYGADDDAMRFAFFSRATMEFLYKTNRRPDVIHCHDWQTGLIPVLLYEMYAPLGMEQERVCYTIHNFKHQGGAGEQVLRATGLHRPEHFFHHDRLRDDVNPFGLNLMRGGIVYANFVTTVSPRHAEEVKHSEQGHGLRHILNTHAGKFGGVLNGVDYDSWNPEKDDLIPHHYSVDELAGKYGNKEALRDRLLLRKDAKPIVAYVGRLDSQKGVHLIRHTLFRTLERGGQFVLLGSSPDPAIDAEFQQLKVQFNDHPDVHLELAFDEKLAHLIYAGADMMVVPSIFEPCGLTQMIAMRYGTIPIVRAVGGLADTVFDKDYGHVDPQWRNGFVFHEADVQGLESALDRALGLFHDYPQDFRSLMQSAMRHDNSWNHPGQHYVNIYEHIRS
ncbi:MAG: glycogen synthase [Deltaproteobacteria bacterium]|nr:glycogen synthase [Deltaproteobacteria bacterium]